MTQNRVTIVIPAYNEEAAVYTVVQSLMERLPGVELLVIDDGSTDRTGQVAQEAGAKVIEHSRCMGYGAGLRTGTLASPRDFVLSCDADGQHNVDDVERLIGLCDNYDMVVGVRDKSSHVSLRRAPGKFLLRWFANVLAGQIIPDLNSGLRIMRRDVLLRYMHLMPMGFSFSTTITFAMLKSNRRVHWTPITVNRRVGKSTVRQWKHGPLTIMLVLRLMVLFEPLKVFMPVAGLFFLLAAGSVGLDLYSSPVEGISDTSVILTVTAVLVFMFALLVDQVAALRRELHE